MNDNVFRQLIRYIKPKYWYHLGGIALVIFGIMFTVEQYQIRNFFYLFMGILFTLLIGVGCIAIGIYKHYSYRKKLQYIKNEDRQTRLLYDFQQGNKAFNGKLILGSTFVMGKHSGIIREYAEIVRIYQFIPSNNYIGKEPRFLKIETATERDITLCAIDGKGKSDKELATVIDFVLSKNDKVQVGFIGL
ncbi:MAG: hypothetical protein IJU14_08480 [Clostridia bacterium]|nr:hypothetical protein [Clostridia bacterium]